jgi:hypothetical protein
VLEGDERYVDVRDLADHNVNKLQVGTDLALIAIHKVHAVAK